MTHAVLADAGSTLDGAWGVVLFIGLLVAWLGGIALAISGTVNALSYPRDLWEQTGARRIRWVWQAIFVFALPLAFVYSGFYFLRIRPRLNAAQGREAISQMPMFWHEPPSSTAASDQRSLVRIRIPAVDRLTLVLVMAATFGVIQLAQFGSGYHFANVGGAALGATLGVLLVTTRVGIDLTPTHAIIRNRRKRYIRWADIAAVAPDRKMGTRRVLLWTTAGRRFVLRAPVASFPFNGRAHYEQDLCTIGQWWLDHRDLPV